MGEQVNSFLEEKIKKTIYFAVYLRYKGVILMRVNNGKDKN